MLQQDNLRKVDAAIRAGLDRIAAADSGLKPEVRRQRIEAVRAQTLKTLEALEVDMGSRAKTARAGLEHWSQAAARRRARFADDPTEDATQRG